MANICMGLFNLLPVFPMDGGRILRAFLAMGLPYVRATFWAALFGRIFAGIGAAIAFYCEYPLIAALFIFIYFAGQLEYCAVRRRDKMEAQMRLEIDRLRVNLPPGEPPLLTPL